MRFNPCTSLQMCLMTAVNVQLSPATRIISLQLPVFMTIAWHRGRFYLSGRWDIIYKLETMEGTLYYKVGEPLPLPPPSELWMNLWFNKLRCFNRWLWRCVLESSAAFTSFLLETGEDSLRTGIANWLFWADRGIVTEANSILNSWPRPKWTTEVPSRGRDWATVTSF